MWFAAQFVRVNVLVTIGKWRTGIFIVKKRSDGNMDAKCKKESNELKKRAISSIKNKSI